MITNCKCSANYSLFQPLTCSFLTGHQLSASFGGSSWIWYVCRNPGRGIVFLSHRQASSAHLALFTTEKMSNHPVNSILVLWTREAPDLCFLLSFELSSKSYLTSFLQLHARPEAHASQGGKKSLTSYCHCDTPNFRYIIWYIIIGIYA